MKNGIDLANKCFTCGVGRVPCIEFIYYLVVEGTMNKYVGGDTYYSINIINYHQMPPPKLKDYTTSNLYI